MSKLTETPAPEAIEMIVSGPAGREPRFITTQQDQMTCLLSLFIPQSTIATI